MPAVCTHVGGMTNIVVDGFNGLMSYPRPRIRFHECVRGALLADSGRFDAMARNARETAKMGLDYGSWSEKWISFIDRTVAARG